MGAETQERHPLEPWFWLAAFGFLGLLSGYAAFVTGAHGGSWVPTALLAGPAALASLLFGDTPLHALGVVFGTAAWYGLAAFYVAAARGSGGRAALRVVGVHAASSAALAIIALVAE